MITHLHWHVHLSSCNRSHTGMLIVAQPSVVDGQRPVMECPSLGPELLEAACGP